MKVEGQRTNTKPEQQSRQLNSPIFHENPEHKQIFLKKTNIQDICRKVQ